MKKQKFSKNPNQRMDEIYFIAETCGLVRTGVEWESSKEDRQPYWKDSVSGRQFRLLEQYNVIEVGEDDFDRWANSVLTEAKMPETLDDFSEMIHTLRTFQKPNHKPVKFGRKSKNK